MSSVVNSVGESTVIDVGSGQVPDFNPFGCPRNFLLDEFFAFNIILLYIVFHKCLLNNINGKCNIVKMLFQGYLAQVLSFQYKHSVVAIDSSSHHGNVTDARAARIRKHFASQMRKSG